MVNIRNFCSDNDILYENFYRLRDFETKKRDFSDDIIREKYLKSLSFLYKSNSYVNRILEKKREIDYKHNINFCEDVYSQLTGILLKYDFFVNNYVDVEKSRKYLKENFESDQSEIERLSHNLEKINGIDIPKFEREKLSGTIKTEDYFSAAEKTYQYLDKCLQKVNKSVSGENKDLSLVLSQLFLLYCNYSSVHFLNTSIKRDFELVDESFDKDKKDFSLLKKEMNKKLREFDFTEKLETKSDYQDDERE